MTYTIVDIGASKGEFINYVNEIEKQNGNELYAIEPIKESLESVSSEVNTFNYGIGLKNEKKYLNIYENPELSSFSSIKKNYDKKIWRTHETGFKLKEKREVLIKTLEDFIIENSILKIDFLKVDVQGNDLDVVKSAFNYLDKIRSFVVEISYKNEYDLYENNTTFIDLTNFISSNDFYIYRLVPNGGGECNVFCINKNIDLEWYEKMEKELRFEKAPCLKIDKYNITSVENISIKLKKILKKLNNF